jgi:hypothetical protein
LNVVRSCRISTLIGIVRLATTRRDAETFPYDVDGIGEMSLWIHCFNQIAGDVAAMFESGEEPIWIQLSPFTRNEWINAYTQFEFGHHKHDHVERIESLEPRLEYHHFPFLCSSGAGSPEHMATVSFKHRG